MNISFTDIYKFISNYVIKQKIRYKKIIAIYYLFQEFDHPYILLQKETGYLKNMVNETGSTMAEILRTMAISTYNSAL